jgi:hypothetical protein
MSFVPASEYRKIRTEYENSLEYVKGIYEYVLISKNLSKIV